MTPPGIAPPSPKREGTVRMVALEHSDQRLAEPGQLKTWNEG